MVARFLESFSEQVLLRGDKLAVEENGVELTYNGLDRRSDAIAQRLLGNGCEVGVPVAYLGGFGLPLVAAMFGAFKAGVPFLPLDSRQPAEVLSGLARQTEIGALLLDDEALRPLAEKLTSNILATPCINAQHTSEPFTYPEIDPDQPAYFRYTSGSTGKSKILPVSFRTEDRLVELTLETIKITSNDRTGLFGHFWPESVLAALSVGGDVFCYDFPGRGPGELAGWLKENRLTIMATYVAIFRAMEIGHETNLPDLRFLRVAGEALTRDDQEKFNAITVPGAELNNAFGTTECSYIANYKYLHGAPIEYDRLPLGYPCEPEHFVLVDAEGQPVPQGEVGEMVLFSPSFVHGYYKDPERTAAAYRPLPCMNADVAYFTGDQAFFDAQGILHPVGRLDDQVKIRGYNVRLHEVETVVGSFAGVAQVAVAPVEGPKGIRRLVCHLVPEDGIEFQIDSLRSFLRTSVPGYMVPSHFAVHETLPTTHTGKILRRALPNPLEAADKLLASRKLEISSTQGKLLGIWEGVIGHADFGLEDDFFDVGGDSLQAMAMVIEIENVFGYRMPLETLVLDGATISRLSERIDSDLAGHTSTLKPLNRADGKTAAYAIPVAGGHMSDYLALAHELEPVLSFMGAPFGPSMESNGSGATLQNLATLPQQLIAAEPGETALIFGYSFGGAVAYEVASKLSKQNKQVSLVLIDAVPIWVDPLRMARAVWRAARDGDIGLLQRRLRQAAGGMVSGAKIEEQHTNAIKNFQPKPSAIQRTLVIVSDENPRKEETIREWNRLVGSGVDIAGARGDHFTMMREPHVAGLAKTIRDWLDTTKARPELSGIPLSLTGRRSPAPGSGAYQPPGSS